MSLDLIFLSLLLLFFFKRNIITNIYQPLCFKNIKDHQHFAYIFVYIIDSEHSIVLPLALTGHAFFIVLQNVHSFFFLSLLLFLLSCLDFLSCYNLYVYLYTCVYVRTVCSTALNVIMLLFIHSYITYTNTYFILRLKIKFQYCMKKLNDLND